jgi:DNA-binding transcriptional LysR family regulator
MRDLHRLQLLRELAARGTITAVAHALAFTPSAVSQQLRTLEGELGVTLLERRGRIVILTAAGAALVAGADEVFRATERAVSAAHAAAGLVGGSVHVGAFTSVGATVIPSAFAALRRSHPTLELHFSQSQDTGRRELKLGHLDIWIDQHYTLLHRLVDEQVTEHELLAEPIGLAVPATIDRGPELDAYRDQPWIGSPPATACRRLLERLGQDTEFEPDVRFLTEDPETILQLVAAELGVAILPRLATARLPPGVIVHPLDVASRRVLALTRAASTDQPSIAVVLAALLASGRSRTASQSASVLGPSEQPAAAGTPERSERSGSKAGKSQAS